ncbi:MAG TPA: hypothetical protein PK181_08770, partial [Methanothrix soehngenii]|nr:hypothetical protein [Methanothrix soehngenii]
ILRETNPFFFFYIFKPRAFAIRVVFRYILAFLASDTPAGVEKYMVGTDWKRDRDSLANIA